MAKPCANFAPPPSRPTRKKKKKFSKQRANKHKFYMKTTKRYKWTLSWRVVDLANMRSQGAREPINFVLPSAADEPEPLGIRLVTMQAGLATSAWDLRWSGEGCSIGKRENGWGVWGGGEGVSADCFWRENRRECTWCLCNWNLPRAPGIDWLFLLITITVLILISSTKQTGEVKVHWCQVGKCKIPNSCQTCS